MDLQADKHEVLAPGWVPGITRHLNALVDSIRYRALSAAGLTIGSVSAAKVKITNTVTYLHNGIFKSKATAEIAFTATTHDIAASATLVQEAIYLVALAADGTPTLHMGPIASGAGNAVPPVAPAGLTVIGLLRLAVAAGATPFDASSDDLSAAHLTDTYVDLGEGCRTYKLNPGDG